MKASTPGCRECERLAKELEQVKSARDQALQALVEEREKVRALRSALEMTDLEPLPTWAPLPDEPTPLRYVIADATNDLVKGSVGSLHRAAKQLFDVLRPR